MNCCKKTKSPKRQMVNEWWRWESKTRRGMAGPQVRAGGNFLRCFGHWRKMHRVTTILVMNFAISLQIVCYFAPPPKKIPNPYHRIHHLSTSLRSICKQSQNQWSQGKRFCVTTIIAENIEFPSYTIFS